MSPVFVEGMGPESSGPLGNLSDPPPRVEPTESRDPVSDAPSPPRVEPTESDRRRLTPSPSPRCVLPGPKRALVESDILNPRCLWRPRRLLT